MQFFQRPNKHRDSYPKCWLLLCLTCLIIAPEPLLAKTGKNAHPVKKVDVTPNANDTDIWSFTLESNTYRSTAYLNPVLDFSSSDGWDLQIACYNIPLSGGNVNNQEWESYINLSKTFSLTDSFKTLIGTQNGTSLFSSSRQWQNFDYGLLIYQLDSSLNLHIGSYLADKALSTTTDTVGYTAGFGLELIKNKLMVQGVYFSGHSSVSGANVSLYYQVLPKTQIYLGVGVPETNSGNEFYGIAGFTLASK